MNCKKCGKQITLVGDDLQDNYELCAKCIDDLEWQEEEDRIMRLDEMNSELGEEEEIDPRDI